MSSGLWFGRVLAWSAAPGGEGQTLRQARYCGTRYVMERLGRSAADQHGVYPGWHLWRPESTAAYPGQLGGYLAADLTLARQLAEARIITACPVYSTPGQPSLFGVLRGAAPIQTLPVAGQATSVVARPDPVEPVVAFHRYDLTDDPHMGIGELLAQIRAEIHRPADGTSEPVTIDWTAHLVGGPAIGRVHASWDAAHTDLLAALSTSSRLAPA